MGYYIHIPDPGFPDAPYPNERRLGPYNTKEEAEAQAVSDVAAGMGAISGIFSEEESAKRATPTVGPTAQVESTAEVTSEDVEAQAAVVRRRIEAASVASQQEQEEMLRASLPEGVEWADLQQLATEMRATAARRVEEDAT